jgi:hypothetical protein
MFSWQCAATLLCLLTRPAPAVESPSPAVPWERLKTLVGTWQRTDASTAAQKAFRIRYHLISADTALVEEFGDPAKQGTQTVFHLDGSRLLATHYCAQGNQPRLRLRAGAPDAMMFEFLDATNLRSASDSHLVRLTFRWKDADHLTREEVYATSGREEVGTLVLERAR